MNCKIEKRFKLLLLILIPILSRAQDISITQFNANTANLEARMHPRTDRNGDECALIRFQVRDTKFDIEGNLGIIETIKETGFIKVYVPHGTKKLTVRHKGLFPLVDYIIPLKIEKKVTYDARIEVNSWDESVWEQKTIRRNSFYVGAGFNIMSIMGSSGSFGINLNHNVIEYTFVYGLNKSNSLLFYNSAGNVQTKREFNAIRSQLRYGYSIYIGHYLALTPMIGGCYNLLKGNAIGDTTADNPYKKQGWSLSGSISFRTSVSLGNRIRIHVTPEYDFVLHESELCKQFKELDSKIETWSQGFNLNAGLTVSF